MQVFFYNIPNKREKGVKTIPSIGYCQPRLP